MRENTLGIPESEDIVDLLDSGDVARNIVSSRGAKKVKMFSSKGNIAFN